MITDPHTGQTKTKKKLGGAYPGQRRPNKGPHVPDDSQFGKDGKAVLHFKAYGGGNALTLVKQDGTSQPATGMAAPQYIQGLCMNPECEGAILRDLCSLAHPALFYACSLSFIEYSHYCFLPLLIQSLSRTAYMKAKRFMFRPPMVNSTQSWFHLVLDLGTYRL